MLNVNTLVTNCRAMDDEDAVSYLITVEAASVAAINGIIGLQGRAMDEETEKTMVKLDAAASRISAECAILLSGYKFKAKQEETALEMNAILKAFSEV